jgi:hypothetical protein
MTTDRKLKIIFGMLTMVLLISLLIKLKSIPGGMILSGLNCQTNGWKKS